MNERGTHSSGPPETVSPPLTEGQQASLPEEAAAEIEEIKEDALDFLEGLLDAMDLEGEVSAEVLGSDNLQLSIEGSDGGLLIGRRGRTLEAVQELLRAALRRESGKRVRVSVDVEGYRQRRRETIEADTGEAISRALQGGEVELEPMTSYERKIVHDIVSGTEGVTSFSAGEEPRRRIVIRGVGVNDEVSRETS